METVHLVAGIIVTVVILGMALVAVCGALYRTTQPVKSTAPRSHQPRSTTISARSEYHFHENGDNEDSGSSASPHDFDSDD